MPFPIGDPLERSL